MKRQQRASERARCTRQLSREATPFLDFSQIGTRVSLSEAALSIHQVQGNARLPTCHTGSLSRLRDCAAAAKIYEMPTVKHSC